jgi:predicted nucleic acid-binding Zn ribbon protein
MEDLYRTTHPSQGNDKDHQKRKLKRLRFMLIFWFISFVIVVLWFYLSPND